MFLPKLNKSAIKRCNIISPLITKSCISLSLKITEKYLLYQSQFNIDYSNIYIGQKESIIIL